jgi:hypothetical protein
MRVDVVITNSLPSARAKLRLDPTHIWDVNARCVVAIGSGKVGRVREASCGS